MRERCFVVASGYNGTKLPASNLALPPDANLGADNTFLELNYQWRRLIPYLFNSLYDRRIYSGSDAEIDDAVDNVDKLIAGLYFGVDMALTVDEIRDETGVALPDVSGFSSVPFTSGNAFDPLNPTRLYLPSGSGLISGNINFDQTTGGWAYAGIRINGTTIVAMNSSHANNVVFSYSINYAGIWQAGDYAEFVYDFEYPGGIDITLMYPSLSVLYGKP
jgi:hypothetical protein